MKTALLISLPLILAFASCENKSEEPVPKDPDKAEKVSVDRFSDQAATLMKRSLDASLPGPDEPVNFDVSPLLSTSLGPDGRQVQYYNFDVQPTSPAPIYVLFREGEDDPVAGQINIIDKIPGEEGYNDFWQVYKVSVPSSYQANTLSSLAGINSSGYAVEATETLVNCPVVPEGSTASKRMGGESSALHRGWYKDKVVYYFTFEEKALSTTPVGTVPLSPIYVTFNKNPDAMDPTSGPPSGIKTEPGSDQSHNVIETIPSDDLYSPLWIVNVYDNADFDNVSDLTSAKAANILMEAAMNVNCPVVFVAE
jgi:hypothetical protein